MLWLNIMNNESFLLFAETLLIVTGSMLLGILLSYLYSGGLKTKLADLTLRLEEERKNTADLREQIAELSHVRAGLQNSILELQEKAATQSRTIYDQQQYLYDRDAVARQHKTTVEGLQATIDAYEQRLGILLDELEKAQTPEQRPRKTSITPTLRANFEHVSQLLGRQVTENDLTLITGIGPKTAALLQSNQINTWEDLANAPLEKLQQILQDAGGIYKAQDPSHWAKQAVMASRGEWRKLRVYQEALRKNEKNG